VRSNRSSREYRDGDNYRRDNDDENNRNSSDNRYGGRDFGTIDGREQRRSTGSNRTLTHSRQSSSSRRNTRNSRPESEHGRQGFASMSREEVQRIASKGGKAHAKNGSSKNRNGRSRSRNRD
jgi:hypothetical protein